jgi:hypothetical protein
VLYSLGVQGSFVGIVVGALLYQERDKVVWWSWWSHEVDLSGTSGVWIRLHNLLLTNLGQHCPDSAP